MMKMNMSERQPARRWKRFGSEVKGLGCKVTTTGELDAGKKKMEVVVAAMRKLLHLVYGVLKHQEVFDENYLPARP